MKRILIIGKNSFVGKNLFFYLNEYFKVKKISFYDFKRLKKNQINKFDFVINCSLLKKYTTKNYSEANDIDLQIAKKISKFPIRMIFLSSRKVYKSKNNIRENSPLKPLCFYSKNKLKTENKITNLLNDKVLILRISNLIGKIYLRPYHRKIHHTFFDNFFGNIKKNIIFNNKNIYKDFITTKKLGEIVRKLMIKKTYGVFNVSIGEKIYLDDMVSWLNYYNVNKNLKLKKLPKNFNKDCFYLNNSKLKNKINIKIVKSDLKNFCIELSREFFSSYKFKV